MLRLACCLATEGGIAVCAPIHDALLVEAPLDELAETVAATEEYMRLASSIVLGDFELRTEAKLVRYPDRYMDERGLQMWETIWEIVDDLKTACA